MNTLELAELESLLDHDLVCAADHEMLAESGFDLPCTYYGIAATVYCDITVVVCESILTGFHYDENGKPLGRCSVCGTACMSVVHL